MKLRITVLLVTFDKGAKGRKKSAFEESIIAKAADEAQVSRDQARNALDYLIDEGFVKRLGEDKVFISEENWEEAIKKAFQKFG